MKKGIIITLLILALASACCMTTVAFAAPARWFGNTVKEDNTANITSWIKVTVTGEDCFAADEEYTAEFTVRQWAEDGNYKLVLSGVRFYDPQETENLDPDYMWEYYTGNDWSPITGARGLELIPVVELKTYTAYLTIRVKPGIFDVAGFAEYLEYSLELTAALITY